VDGVIKKKSKSNPILHTKDELIKLGKKYNLEVCLGLESYELYSPEGYMFKGMGTHVIVEPHRNASEYKKEAINDLVEFILKSVRSKEPLLVHCKKGCACGWDE
jgi:hypothetical protein